MSNTNTPSIPRTLPEDQIRERLAAMDIDDLRDLLDGNWPNGGWRLAGKIQRQREANDRMQRKVENQRLVLRTINELGRGLTDDEWTAAKEGVASDQLRERMTEKVPVPA